MRHADLTGINFTNASLRNTQFQGANLTRVNLSGADLGGSCFTEPCQLGLVSCEHPCDNEALITFAAPLLGQKSESPPTPDQLYATYCEIPFVGRISRREIQRLVPDLCDEFRIEGLMLTEETI